jgi:hypothetical protein
VVVRRMPEGLEIRPRTASGADSTSSRTYRIVQMSRGSSRRIVGSSAPSTLFKASDGRILPASTRQLPRAPHPSLGAWPPENTPKRGDQKRYMNQRTKFLNFKFDAFFRWLAVEFACVLSSPQLDIIVLRIRSHMRGSRQSHTA